MTSEADTRRVVLYILAVIIGVSQGSLAGPAGGALGETRNLRGLESVWVNIQPASNLKGYDVPLRRIQTRVELCLRRNGVRVTTRSEAPNSGELRFMLLLVPVARRGSERMDVIAVGCDLWEAARLLRDPAHKRTVSTWGQTLYLPVSGADFSDLPAKVIPVVEEFCNDYLAAQP